MKNPLLDLAMEKLARQFETLPWTYNMIRRDGRDEIVRLWPGDPKEEIMIAVLRGYDFHEPLHRQNYYFLNYAYEGSYRALSDRPDNEITICEGECYVGQPFCGYGIRQSGDAPGTVIGVLIQKELFYRDFLPIVSSAPAIFRFFIDPQRDAFSSDFLRFAFPKDSPVRTLLEMMIVEYADQQQETPAILRSLTAALLLQIARRCRVIVPADVTESLTDQITRYMAEHMESVSLSDLSAQFAYHPTYLSNMLHAETGETFSEILLRLRMERAGMLMRGTTLSVEEIAAMVGYSSTSNFYKSFRRYFGISPREYSRR